MLNAVDGSQPCVVVISNPNGPTGYTFEPHEIEDLAELCSKKGHLFMIDACYALFARQRPWELTCRRSSTVVIQSLSKMLGIPGGRLAVIFADPRLIDYLSRWKPQIAISGVTLSVTSALISRFSEVEAIHEDILANRDWFATEMVRHTAVTKALPSGGNFQCFVLKTNEHAATLALFLRTQGIHIKHMSSLTGLVSTIRITAADRGSMSDALRAIQHFNPTM